MRRLAIIDLGTNSARLLVADVSDAGEWSPVVSDRVACRLGAGLSESGRIDPQAEKRSAQALLRLAEQVDELGQVPLRVVATHALRSAANGAAVHARLEETLQRPITVLSGEQEAHLVLRAAQRWIEPSSEPLIALDLGGGSLELAVQPFHPTQALAPQLLSLPLGSVVMSEVTTSGIVSRQEVARLGDRVRTVLQAQAASMHQMAHRVVGAGGTVVCVAAVLGFPPPRNGVRFSTDALGEVVGSLASMDLAARAAMPMIGDRADIIVAGVVVLQEVLRYLGAGECIVLEHGVREGALLAFSREEL